MSQAGIAKTEVIPPGTYVQTLTGDSGGPVSSDGAGNIDLLGGANITVDGNPGANELEFNLTGTTDHAVQVGNASGSLTSVSPSATSGVPLISQGAAADPVFGTAVVAGGGTGATSFTSYAVVCGGTTATNPLQSIASVGTAGQILTSNGAGLLPTFQAAASSGFTTVVVQTFTSSDTYTPTANMKYCTIEVIGGGGGGGGLAASGAATVCGAAGGGGGGYARKTVTAATIGASQTVTIGAGGAGGANGNTTGGTGGTSSVGTIVTATGGAGGTFTSGATAVSVSQGGAGGVGGSGDINIAGGPGGCGFGVFAVSLPSAFGGAGGNSVLGGGATPTSNVTDSTTATANNGNNYGGGGGGGANSTNGAANTGGDGAAGLVVITEFI